MDERQLSMLAEDKAWEAITFGADGLITGLDTGAMHISMNTIAVATTDRLSGAHGAAAQRFACAPGEGIL